ncbi:tetr bacterial regulatory protein hth signature [Lucifera butyrica]|uniref:Tetr bacterial regulatory protein hth signature n=1 Tax=Lucifera butyrica TaxID=1351585 RepID=A0A498R0Y3_9FIRM|nr:TetR/AcrR family transcriptional regulator [Lucifera butyrica]VBB04981.1 tetr bacterial regulatory protein hth signature [Lucifera butyrica]
MDDIKNFILDKAKERFGHFGYKKTTMDEISQDCKISKKTIYEHFNNKEDLFTNLMAREFYKARQVLFDGIHGIPDPLAKLIQAAKAVIAFFNEDSFLAGLFEANEILFPPFASQKYDSMIRADFISIVAEIIREGKKQGKFRDVDEKIVANAGVRLFQICSYVDFPQDKEQKDYYTAVLVDFIVNGIVKKNNQ